MEALGEKEHEAYAAGRRFLTVDGGDQVEHTVRRYIPVPPKVVTPNLLRQLFAGALDMSTLPAALAGELRTIARRIERQANRAAKREHHAIYHRRAALAGGGEREVSRRRRQDLLQRKSGMGWT
jgi:hypothetical protein